MRLAFLPWCAYFSATKTLDDKRLEQLQRHLFGQAALVELELRADYDNGTAGVIHALAQEVLAETPLLAAQQVADSDFKRAVARSRHGAAAAAVINQCVHSLLQHALSRCAR